jgi:hypothetical protein
LLPAGKCTGWTDSGRVRRYRSKNKPLARAGSSLATTKSRQEFHAALLAYRRA